MGEIIRDSSYIKWSILTLAVSEEGDESERKGVEDG
jgi:hypothetical protein